MFGFEFVSTILRKRISTRRGFLVGAGLGFTLAALIFWAITGEPKIGSELVKATKNGSVQGQSVRPNVPSSASDGSGAAEIYLTGDMVAMTALDQNVRNPGHIFPGSTDGGSYDTDSAAPEFNGVPDRRPDNVSAEDLDKHWRDLVDAKYQTEGVNAEAIKVGSTIREIMNEFGQSQGVLVESSSCRKTICISEIKFPPEVDIDRFIIAVVSRLGWSSSQFRLMPAGTSAKGTNHVKFYLTRDGSEFPVS